jgi:YjbE family integral membrane protein
MTLDYLASICKLILIDLVLSGDNAVVIGLAAHLLPHRQRRQALIWGCGMAIAMRIALTLVVAQLLLFPGLRFVGGLLLVWIACKLVKDEADSRDTSKPPPTTLLRAITRIAMADFIMSLDNIVAIAGASQSDPVRVIIGLALSITMLLLLSAVIMEIMSRYRWIAYLGAAVLAWTAADLMIHDLDQMVGSAPHGVLDVGFPVWAAWTLRIGVTLVCLTTNRWWTGTRTEPPPESANQDQTAPSLERARLT